jgi:3-hydroxymyristoyl/3-hydroxydecanoyl-(acyl carrier protein) dehydratase
MPGEFLGCPHTYEANQSVLGGAWFIQPGNATMGGVLIARTKIQVTQYKTQFNQ